LVLRIWFISVIACLIFSKTFPYSRHSLYCSINRRANTPIYRVLAFLFLSVSTELLHFNWKSNGMSYVGFGLYMLSYIIYWITNRAILRWFPCKILLLWRLLDIWGCPMRMLCLQLINREIFIVYLQKSEKGHIERLQVVFDEF
jgi:hypothetical protein